MTPTSRSSRAAAQRLAVFFLLAFGALAASLGYWTFVARNALLARDDNPRALIAFNRIRRGSILDRNGIPLAETVGQPGDYVRRYEPSTALVVGYASFVYGASGVEAAADGALSGAEGQDEFARWWKHDLLGEPQAGRDVQLTLDIALQRAAFDALDGRAGAVVIVDTTGGDILAIASSPSFDPARIDADFETFTADSNGPLVNRATFGLYRADALLDLFPDTLDLSQPPTLPIPVRAPEGARLTPLHMAFLLAAVPNDGVMPAPKLIPGLQSPTSSHPIAIMPPADARQLHSLLGEAAGVAVTIPSGFGDETLGWFVGLSPDGSQAIAVVIEGGNAAEASAAGIKVQASARK